MIPNYLRVIFWSLVACIVLMAVVLFHSHQEARNRVASLSDQTPIDAPYTISEPITFDIANDNDGSITATQRNLALPSESTSRARALLDHLIAEYGLPGSAHPLQTGGAIADVFLVPLPVTGHTVDASAPANAGITPATTPVDDPSAIQPQSPGGELAVINLRSSFVNAHPSGVEVESMTLLSIIGTLHANLPQIEQVRFLVDGQPRETLAGHADLLRVYPSRDTTTPAAAKTK